MREVQKEGVTLMDRFGVALLSAIAALLTGTFFWVITFYALARFSDLRDYQLPFTPVLIFVSIMASLGFLTKINLVTNILGAIWGLIYKSRNTW